MYFVSVNIIAMYFRNYILINNYDLLKVTNPKAEANNESSEVIDILLPVILYFNYLT